MEKSLEPGTGPAASINPAQAGGNPDAPPVVRSEGHLPATLIPATPADRDNRGIYLMLQHIGGRKEGFSNPANGLTFTAWQEFADRLADTPSSGGEAGLTAHSAEHWYWFWQEGACLGYGILRLQPDPDTLRNHGHIAYAIRRDRRGKGLGRGLLGLLLKEARFLGLADPVLVCAEANHASRRVIEAEGGVLTGLESGKCRYRLGSTG